MGKTKYILLTALCAIYLGQAYAQPRLRAPEFYIGARGGVIANTIMFSPGVENMTPITNACVLGGNGGLVFRYAGHKYCAFQMELNYQHRGWAEKNTTGYYNRGLHYIELPAMMHLHFGSDRCRWFLNLGPQIGYCVYDDKGKGNQLSTDKTQYAPIDHPFDWGITAGTGLCLPTRHAGVYELEVRFDYSFGGIFGTSLIDHYNVANPMDLSINIAWLWGIKSRRKAIRRDKLTEVNLQKTEIQTTHIQ